MVCRHTIYITSRFLIKKCSAKVFFWMSFPKCFDQLKTFSGNINCIGKGRRNSDDEFIEILFVSFDPIFKPKRWIVVFQSSLKFEEFPFRNYDHLATFNFVFALSLSLSPLFDFNN